MITVNSKADLEWAVDDLTEYIRAGGRAFDWLRAAKLSSNIVSRCDDGTPDIVHYSGINWLISLGGVRAEAIAFDRFVEQLPDDVVEALRRDVEDHLTWYDDGEWGFDEAWERADAEVGLPGEMEDIFYEYMKDDWDEAFNHDRTSDALLTSLIASIRHRFYEVFDRSDALGSYIVENDGYAMFDAFLDQVPIGTIAERLAKQYREMSDEYWNLVERKEE